MKTSLQDLRKAKGLTLGALAAQLGVTPGQVSHWERGRNRIPDEKVRALAKIFEVPVENIVTDRITSYPSQSWIAKIRINGQSATAAFIDSLKASAPEIALADETSIEAAFITFVEKNIAASLQAELAKHPEIGEQLRKKTSSCDLTKR